MKKKKTEILEITRYRLQMINDPVVITTGAGEFSLTKPQIRNKSVTFHRTRQQPRLTIRNNGTMRVTLKKKDYDFIKEMLRL